MPKNVQTMVELCSLHMLTGGSSGTRTHLPVQETQETGIRSLGQEDDFREVMATHFSVLAWRIPWTEEPGGLDSIESQRVMI